MTQYVEGPTKAFTAGAAIAKHLRVKLSSGVLAVAGAGTSDEPVEIGTIEEAAFAAGDLRSVRMRNAQGTVKMVASAAIAAEAAVYGAAGGKIDDTTSGAAIGIALEAATADGDIIEVLRY